MNHKRTALNRPRRALLAFTLSALAASYCFAADAGGDETSTVNGEKIVVLPPFQVEADTGGYYASNALSATRVRFSVEDLSTPIQVITAKFLQDLNITDLGDTLHYANNVTRVDDGRSQSFVGASFLIRGFQAPVKRNGMDTFTFANAHVIERIEIPKGPESVLYGQASPGGVINFITKRANFVPFRGNVNVLGGADEFRDTSLDMGGALTEKLAWRLVTNYHHEGGYQDYMESIDTLIYPTLAWRITDKIRLDVSYEWLDRAQTDISRPLTAGLVGLTNIAPAPDGTPASLLGTAKGNFFLYQLPSFYGFGDSRAISLQHPLDRGKGYGQFVLSKSLNADLSVNLMEDLDLRVAAEHMQINRHSHSRMADILNFSSTSKTGTSSPRERKRYEDSMKSGVQVDLASKYDFTLPILGKSTLNTVVGFEWTDVGGNDGAIETPLNSGKIMPIEGLYPDAFQGILQTNGLTRQDLINRGSELVGTPSSDPRLEDLAPDSAFLSTAGNFLRGGINRTEYSGTAYYVNEILSMRDNRIRLSGGWRHDENKYAGVSLSPNWSLTETGRTTYDSAGDSWSAGASFTVLKNKGVIDTLNFYAGSSTSWKASNTRAEYRIATELGEYGTDNNGVSGFGFVPDSTAPLFPFRAVYKLPAPTPLDPEKGKGYDIGFKFTLLDHKLSGSVGYFKVTRSGIVRNTYMLKPIDATRYNPATFDPKNPPTLVGLTGLTIPTMSGEEESHGVEVELSYRPNKNWDIYLGATQMKSVVLSNDQDPTSIGRPLAFTPDTSWKLVVKHTFAAEWLKKLTLGVGINYWSRSYGSTAAPLRYTYSGPYTIVGMFGSYELLKTKRYKAALRFNVDNIEDKIYVDSNFRWGQPRTIRGGVDLAF